MSAANPVVCVRMTAGERDLLEAAAEQARTSLSDFMRRKAIEAAETDLLDRRIVTIPAASWEIFEAWAAAPAKPVPAFQKLAATPPTWEQG